MLQNPRKWRDLLSRQYSYKISNMLIGKAISMCQFGDPKVCRCGRSGKVRLDLPFKEIQKLTPQNNHTLNLNTAINADAFYFTIKLR